MQTRPHTSHRNALLCGIRDGIPIGLGYLAVSFSLGIAARSAGLNAFQGFLISILNNASAGEYAAFTVIAADSGLLEMALITLITNARYLLMSCSLSQRFSPDTPMLHRLLVGYDVTDELFGMFLAIIVPPARKSKVVCACVLVSFAASGLCSVLPLVSTLSEGTRTIILTVVIASAAALAFPVKDDPAEPAEKEETGHEQ